MRNYRRYDELGLEYLRTRRPDPRIAARIDAALGAAQTVVNVGAGTGNYEPHGRSLVAVEPSLVMIAQRAPGSAVVVRAVAENLPFKDSTFSASMALWTVHHWANPIRGISELRRVGRKIIIVCGSVKLNELWLTRDYFPSMAKARRPEIQPEVLLERLGGNGRIEAIPIPRDCTDGFGEAHWARPEAYLMPEVQLGTSAFRLLPSDELKRGLAKLRSDLEAGRWDARNEFLRDLEEFDCGLRMIVATH